MCSIKIRKSDIFSFAQNIRSSFQTGNVLIKQLERGLARNPTSLVIEAPAVALMVRRNCQVCRVL